MEGLPLRPKGMSYRSEKASSVAQLALISQPSQWPAGRVVRRLEN